MSLGSGSDLITPPVAPDGWHVRSTHAYGPQGDRHPAQWLATPRSQAMPGVRRGSGPGLTLLSSHLLKHAIRLAFRLDKDDYPVNHYQEWQDS